MKIYFAGSIRAGRQDAGLYRELIELLRSYGRVLTEHVGDPALPEAGEKDRTDKEIFLQDMDWLEDSDLLVAEVTTPSLGVGYEIAWAEAMGKRILCLFRPSCGRRLSAMLAGNKRITVGEYETPSDAAALFEKYLVPIP